jgi:hypothetical protein
MSYKIGQKVRALRDLAGKGTCLVPAEVVEVRGVGSYKVQFEDGTVIGSFDDYIIPEREHTYEHEIKWRSETLTKAVAAERWWEVAIQAAWIEQLADAMDVQEMMEQKRPLFMKEGKPMVSINAEGVVKSIMREEI